MRESHYWLLFQIAAVILFVFLGMHLVMMHLDDILHFFGVDMGDATSWSSVMQRAGSSSWLAIYIIFLALALYHGFYGLRVILIELPLPHFAIRTINWAIPLIGVAVFAYGIYIPINAYL